MRFFLDENFPKAAGVLLRSIGHESIDVRGTGHEGMADDLLFAEVQRHQAIFLTTDRDFFHTIELGFKSQDGTGRGGL